MKFLILAFFSTLGLQSMANEITIETVILRPNQSLVIQHYFRSNTHPHVYIVEEGVRCCHRNHQQCQEQQQQQAQAGYVPPIKLVRAMNILAGETVFYKNKLYSCGQ